jgi:hypothetical protein
MSHLPFICNSFFRSEVSLTTGTKPLPRWAVHRMQYSVSSFNFQRPLLSLRSCNSCLCLLPHIYVSSVFPSMTYFRRQFPRNMWPIRLTFLSLLYVGYSFPSWLCVILLHFPHDRSSWTSTSFFSTAFQKFLIISSFRPPVILITCITKPPNLLCDFRAI